MTYLPKHANIEQACLWLTAKTGDAWTLPRILEHGLTPHFWIDFTPGVQPLFDQRVEGYLSSMVFAGDLQRLEADGGDALVNMFTAANGALVKAEPALRVPFSELRFLREDVQSIGKANGATQMPLDTALDWRNVVRTEAYEQWVRILATNGTPTLKNVSVYLAEWCKAHEVKTDTGIPPSASYLKVHVIDGKHWAPPRNISREDAKKHFEQKKQTI
jgi:hypothetical protein